MIEHKKKTLGLLLFVFILMTSCQQKQNNKLTIATASNMQFAIKQLAKKFTEQTGIKCDLIISSSGKLTAQISEGAPFDIFVSADMNYPSKLYHTGHTIEKPKIYAYGKLVLWTMHPEISPSIEILTHSDIDHIAIANPKTAPYGLAALDVLKKKGIYEDVKDKLVYGESISQTNQFIASKSAKIGFTSKSVVLSSTMVKKGAWKDIDTTSYSVIEQGVVMIKRLNGNHNSAKKFYKFLFSKNAKEILINLGYTTP